jgi:hypothetical protein
MRRKEAPTAHLAHSEPGLEKVARNARTGTIAGIDNHGVVMVLVSGDKIARPSRLAIRTSREQIELAIQHKQQVLLLIEEGDPQRPILIGFVEDKLASESAVPKIIEADVDGKRVRLVAQDEIVFECGSASITLRRNGRVVIKGAYVETHSEGTNRIKGGQVRIN